MTLQESIDLERDYRRVSREHRANRVEHWRQRFAPAEPPEKGTGGGALAIAPGPKPKKLKGKSLAQSIPRKCLGCPTMVTLPRKRCAICARARKLANYNKPLVHRVDKPRATAQNDEGGAG